MLDAHSEIHCGPEVTFFRDFYGAYLEDSLAHLRYAQTVRSLLPEDELLPILGSAFVAVHEEAARQAGKRRWADKSPDNVLYLDEWAGLLGDEWLLVHVVRNPLDTIASMAEIGFPLTLPADLDGRIAFYRRYTESGLEFGDRFPDRYRRVVYERLVAAPERELAELMGWLGAEPEPTQLDFSASQHQAGLEDPKIEATSAVHGASVGRWRSLLAPDDAAAAWAATRDLWERIDPRLDAAPLL
jgi:hypothetical protein